MDDFMRVDIADYVNKGLEDGVLVPIYAKKTAMIHAVQGELGEKVISWVENPDGTERIEREGVVGLDATTHERGWIATKVDLNGEPVIDCNGHKNQWIIEDSVFKRTYEESSLEDMYVKKGLQVVVQIPDSVVFVNKYGEEMSVSSGGYINITNPTAMYGISERDFNDTHMIVEGEVSKTK